MRSGLLDEQQAAGRRPRDTAPIDLLSSDVRRTVIWLALPVMGEQVLNACVAWNDQFLAGLLGKSATASVGFAAYLSWFISMMFALVGTGATAIVARAIGAGRRDEAQRETNQAVLLGAMLGVAGFLLVRRLAWWVAGLLALSPETTAMAARYLLIDSIAYPIEAVTFVGAACLRGAGDTRTPMAVLGFVNIVNIAVSWLLAFTLGWGVDGIAWGTVTGRFVGGVLMLYVLTRKRPELRLSRAALRPDFSLIARTLRIGVPAAVDGALMFGGHFAFINIVTRSGGAFDSDTLMAAHMIGIRIESLSYLPATAWGMAAATLMGQNLGAGSAQRARLCANEALRQTVILLSLNGLLYLTCAPWLYRILTSDAGVIACGVPALRALGLVQPALAVLIIYIWSLRGAGDTAFPMMFTFIGMVFLRIPVAYLGGVVLGGALLGAWCGMYADLVVRSGLITWRFRGGGWAKVRV